MVTTIDRTPDLIPLPPEWMQRQSQQGAPSTNRNINDIYWQRPDGWIAVGPSAQLGVDGKMITAQAGTKIRLGWKPLIEYSFTDRVSSKTGQRDTIETSLDRLNTPAKFYWFFVNGGAHLFPIEQIVAYHWHLVPPFNLPKSVFPQLLEWDVPEAYYCPACAGNTPPCNSIEQVVTHLMITHRMTLVQTRELQQSTNDFLDTPRAASGLAIRRKAQAIERAAEAQDLTPSIDLPPPTMNICNDCGEVIEGTDNMAKARHSRSCTAKQPRDGQEG